MIARWRRFLLAWLLLCAGTFPCRAESEAINQWKREVADRLQMYQNFPLEACGHGGEVNVALTIDRTGKLISSDLVSGAGLPAFDRAALELVKNSQPFSPAPPGATESELKFVVVLVFVKPASCEGVNREERRRSTEKQFRSEQEKLRSAISGVCRGC
jgi:TonB family protein